ncbi:hypothetical protein [Amycolatopsis saalfeldensis]|uniref:Vegetative cell wall protein gp1 n=1 Tax=Amycolatopsis saalfeldensis TaxID=394193 RepID=A0A1H8Y3Z1_9PSEU|nr:hypothetical protein [Amycolatopsis saalfeldensis]SEP46974.1 hypothetical protein SAMN04489732_1117 [Amycolatopsis saalfeldensis]
MTGFLEQLSVKIVDRWLANLLVPGLLWLCCAVLAVRLGWAHALDLGAAESLVRELAGPRSAGQALLLVAGALFGSAVAALTAVGLATAVRRVWSWPGKRVPVNWLRQWRARRWNAADRKAVRHRIDVLNSVEDSATTAGPEYRDAMARRDSIGLEPPERPTWIADRWFAAGLRIHRAYGLDLTVVWPRLWLVAPESARNDFAVAQTAYQKSSVTVAWAILYGLAGLFWGPALLIALCLAAIGVLRARQATANLCELVESACDLYGPALAEQLKVPCPDRLTTRIGEEISAQLRKKDFPG